MSVVVEVHELQTSAALLHSFYLFSCPTSSLSMCTEVSPRKIIIWFEIRKSNIST